jgi:hypothetical protein
MDISKKEVRCRVLPYIAEMGLEPVENEDEVYGSWDVFPIR